MLIWLSVVFVSIMVAIIAIGSAMGRRSSRMETLRERLQAIESAEKRSPNPEIAILRDELLSGIPALNKLLARWSRSSRIQLNLEQANVRLRPGKFLLICACCGGAVSTLVLAFTGSFFLALPGFVFGIILPYLYVLILRQRRFHKFEEMFPQAIELLVRSARAGHPFTFSLDMIATELPEPISGEFRRIYEEQKFGLPLRDALLNFAQRIPLLDVKFFITAVLLQRESGGNLAEILDKLAYVIRERFRILRQVRVFTAQGRMTMMILMALPPGMVLLMFFVNPGFIRPLFTDSIGHLLLTAGIMFQTIGFFLIRRIIQIRV
jgi:tight adherence protein B